MKIDGVPFLVMWVRLVEEKKNRQQKGKESTEDCRENAGWRADPRISDTIEDLSPM